MAVNKSRSVVAEDRRSQVVQLKRTGMSNREIAVQLEVSTQQVDKDLIRRLGEIRREDKEAVDLQWALQNSRYERLLMSWWAIATGAPSSVTVQEREAATTNVLKIMHGINSIGGLIPNKPLIALQVNNNQFNIGLEGTTEEQVQDAYRLVRLALTGELGIVDGLVAGNGNQESLDPAHPDSEAD